MNVVTEQSIDCPYCGESISLLIDNSVSQQDYIEDCQVCCRPIRINIEIDPDGGAQVMATNENEA
jgi:hypothetical protein